MDKTGRLLGLLSLVPVTLLPQPASARSHGLLSTQSQATIAIGASVLPHFAVHEGAEALNVTSNAPTLRYNLAVSVTGDGPSQLASGSPWRDPHSIPAKDISNLRGRNLLVLVVPD